MIRDVSHVWASLNPNPKGSTLLILFLQYISVSFPLCLNPRGGCLTGSGNPGAGGD